MTVKLIQKQFLKGSRQFEIIDDAVYVRIKGLLKQEKLNIGLSMLDPHPVINNSYMEFYGRNRDEPVLSIHINQPSLDEFNAFVETLKMKISEANRGGINIDDESSELSRPEAPGWNVYEEPPEFGESEEAGEKVGFQPVNPKRVEEDIIMLKTYLKEDDIQPLLGLLEALKEEPQNQAAFQKVVDAYNELGINQGAVLTYAPYLKVLVSHTLWS
jgi:hypothetical protein